MNNNFSATQISQVINKLNTIGNEMKGYLTNISDNFNKLSMIIMSEDSSLTSTCKNIDSTYQNLATKLAESINTIESELKKYVQRTITNEYDITNSLKRINTQLQQINNLLSRI